MNDFKDYGKPSTMPPALVDLCLGLVALVAVLTVYALVADTPERQIVVTTKATQQREIQQERIKAAQEVMAATECRSNWRDQFIEPKRTGAM
jgi:hypothetical protein